MEPRGRPPLGPGTVLDRYEIERLIAQGGMGAVWLARMRGPHGFERRVALKTIRPEYATEERFRRMFVDEARIASRIDHPNVVRILDLVERDEVLYLVMEWADGVTLKRVAADCATRGLRLPLGVALRIVADTCAGLHAAHELRDERGELLRVVHRDVSPENILIGSTGHARLIDFGIAKARDRLSSETSAGRLKGKPGYIAPEQSMHGRVDRRTDVWAVGAVLFRLLAGRPPFEDLDDLVDFVNGRIDVPPLPPDTPAAVQKCVRRALSASPADRQATAAEVESALEETMLASNAAATALDVAHLLTTHVLADTSAGVISEDAHTSVDVAQASADQATEERAGPTQDELPRRVRPTRKD